MAGGPAAPHNLYMVQKHKLSLHDQNDTFVRMSITKPDLLRQESGKSILKPTLILTALIFLIIAPEPDSHDIADMTANFLVTQNPAILAASTDQLQTVKEEQNR